eukprot:1963705-Amphidinium_carterae.1
MDVVAIQGEALQPSTELFVKAVLNRKLYEAATPQVTSRRAMSGVDWGKGQDKVTLIGSMAVAALVRHYRRKLALEMHTKTRTDSTNCALEHQQRP